MEKEVLNVIRINCSMLFAEVCHLKSIINNKTLALTTAINVVQSVPMYLLSSIKLYNKQSRLLIYWLEYQNNTIFSLSILYKLTFARKNRTKVDCPI